MVQLNFTNFPPEFIIFKIQEVYNMTEDICPLFGWDDPVPNEFKEIFSKYINEQYSRKCSSTLEESLIVDEDQEIIGKSQNENSICPLCYQNFQLSHIQLYSNILFQYFYVHTQCVLTCKHKTAQLALLTDQIQHAQIMEQVPLDYDLMDLNVKVFVEFKVYHSIAQQPQLNLTHSTTLKQKKNTSILLDYANLREQFGKKQQHFIRLMQGFVQIDVYIMDSNLMQESKNVHNYEFYYQCKQSFK
ncbi:unnamed protein product [Paramecium pentaurelia]|uniref:Uncharacterized protein n=1 Tax=Paramecium pentaurelia TaxID=43138 RepID=A0A8S1W2R6_9CILI|nr:unnamed protein product [Paramecium pentaurelia]